MTVDVKNAIKYAKEIKDEKLKNETITCLKNLNKTEKYGLKELILDIFEKVSWISVFGSITITMIGVFYLIILNGITVSNFAGVGWMIMFLISGYKLTSKVFK